ncbi:hypothetical protein [Kitasatospora sp. NPDC056531]|uniref:hypothetical protein n=1 Tax=Kitasatospora sp. NPDC056531 TaxID=3345856 RepID=UPI0036A05DD6
MSNAESAERLVLGETTVKTHVTRILFKLACATGPSRSPGTPTTAPATPCRPPSRTRPGRRTGRRATRRRRSGCSVPEAPSTSGGSVTEGPDQPVIGGFGLVSPRS